jgi:DNA-binding response OmpR family regulator
VIDDEQALRSDLLTILAMEGFDASGASNGAQGLDLARTHLPDLILCDISLYDMTGLEITRALRSDHRTQHIPLVIITAHSDPDVEKASLDAGANYFLTKPFDVDELLNIVKRMLH